MSLNNCHVCNVSPIKKDEMYSCSSKDCTEHGLKYLIGEWQELKPLSVEGEVDKLMSEFNKGSDDG